MGFSFLFTVNNFCFIRRTVPARKNFFPVESSPFAPKMNDAQFQVSRQLPHKLLFYKWLVGAVYEATVFNHIL